MNVLSFELSNKTLSNIPTVAFFKACFILLFCLCEILIGKYVYFCWRRYFWSTILMRFVSVRIESWVPVDSRIFDPLFVRRRISLKPNDLLLRPRSPVRRPQRRRKFSKSDQSKKSPFHEFSFIKFSIRINRWVQWGRKGNLIGLLVTCLKPFV